MENLSIGLTLMAVGMGTVFLVLLIIIFLGNQLIKLVNKFALEEEKVAAKPSQKGVNPRVAQAINLAVAQITGGKGKVIDIK